MNSEQMNKKQASEHGQATKTARVFFLRRKIRLGWSQEVFAPLRCVDLRWLCSAQRLSVQ